MSLNSNDNNRVAYWMSKKKCQKIDWDEFEGAARRAGLELFRVGTLNLNKDLEAQGPFKVLLHKLTDIIALSEEGDADASQTICQIENYVSNHAELLVIDPIDNVRQLLNRFKCYTQIRNSNLDQVGIFTPNFCELNTTDPETIAQQLKTAKITYPFICKPTLGHGSKKAHEMLIIFNENSLQDCIVPCVAQSFINHNAVLFKIFIVGDKYYHVERPSLKNFYASDLEPIPFESSSVSKAGAQSDLSVLEPHEQSSAVVPKEEIFEKIVQTLRKTLGMDLLGVDVVIEKNTGKYGIIDVNAYPGYDGFPNFYNTLFQCIKAKIAHHDEAKTHAIYKISHNDGQQIITLS